MLEREILPPGTIFSLIIAPVQVTILSELGPTNPSNLGGFYWTFANKPTLRRAAKSFNNYPVPRTSDPSNISQQTALDLGVFYWTFTNKPCQRRAT